MERRDDFNSLLRKRWQDANSLICVGLDPDFELLPKSVLAVGEDDVFATSLFAFNEAIIDATADIVCCFKPQFAYYAAYGIPGLLALKRTIEYIHQSYPEVPILLDAKRSDISTTAAKYGDEVFGYYNVDAVTLHSIFGEEANRPYLEYKNKGLFFLCHSSNPGASEFQELKVYVQSGELPRGSFQLDRRPLYEIIAYNISHYWNKYGNCGLIVGATYPNSLAAIRQIIGNDMPILIPGIGTQGGEIESTVKAGANTQGRGIIISSSRSIIYASKNTDFAIAARDAAMKLRDAVNSYL